LIVGPSLVIDLTGREARAIEQYFLFYDRRGAGIARAGFAGHRGELRGIDGLRIKCRCRGM
jgi:hypothetical protein